MLTRAQIIEFFDFYLSADHVSSPKPDPEIYLSAIEKLKLEPSECLILEDNFNGPQAAEASGANVLEIKHVEDVNIWNIEAKIKKIENVL